MSAFQPLPLLQRSRHFIDTRIWNEYGVPGMVASIEGKKGRGTHASLSRFDLHNTLVAAGPDFKKGFVSQMQSGNIDVAPTMLSILGVTPPCPMDGRVLYEAMTGEERS